MTRRVTLQKRISIDREELQVVSIFEEGCSKQEVKRENPYMKRHQVLLREGNSYAYMDKRA